MMGNGTDTEAIDNGVAIIQQVRGRLPGRRHSALVLVVVEGQRVSWRRKGKVVRVANEGWSAVYRHNGRRTEVVVPSGYPEWWDGKRRQVHVAEGRAHARLPWGPDRDNNSAVDVGLFTLGRVTEKLARSYAGPRDIDPKLLLMVVGGLLVLGAAGYFFFGRG